MIGKKWLLLLPLGGILTGLCLILPVLGFLEWVTMTPALVWLFAAVKREKKLRPRAFYGAGILYFLPFYMTIFHWFLALYPMEFAGVSPGAAVGLVMLCWIGLSLLQTIFSALVFPLFAWLSKTTLVRRVPMVTPLLFAAQYAISEWSQTFTWMGVPWARLPLGQVNVGWMMNSAALFGSYFLTFLLVLSNGLVAYLVLYPAKWRVYTAAAAASLLLGFGAGAIGYYSADVKGGTPLIAAGVQGNVGSSEKWSAHSTEQTKKIYREYTEKAAAAGAELVVFPETFLPHTLTEKNEIGKYVSGLADEQNVTIMCGAYWSDGTDSYNAMFTFFPDGSMSETVYAKRRLVPFGEFVPWRAVIEVVFPPLADINMLNRDLTPGADSALVQTPFGKVGGLICFDSIYEELTRDSVRDGANLLVLPTNDSWFLDSAAVYMHSTQARLRAIESGRWIVRSADTGVSSIIDPRGGSYSVVEPLVDGVSIATVYPQAQRTLYSHIGNLFIYLSIVAVLALPVSQVILMVKKRKNL